MSVYVDEAPWPFGRMIMCHMIADTEEELHAMAEKVGLKRQWFQNDNYPHYDISMSKRVMAVENGAIEIGRITFVAIATAQRKAKESKP